jgi:hypothetical protein
MIHRPLKNRLREPFGPAGGSHFDAGLVGSIVVPSSSSDTL